MPPITPACPRGCRPLWRAQRTVIGRLLLGPAMVIVPTWLDIVRRPLRGDGGQLHSWGQHLLWLAALLFALDRWAGIGPLPCLLAVGYPALAMLRSFCEHRPAADPAHRVVVHEAGWCWRLLYLDNTFHAVHHELPGLLGTTSPGSTAPTAPTAPARCAATAAFWFTAMAR